MIVSRCFLFGLFKTINTIRSYGSGVGLHHKDEVLKRVPETAKSNYTKYMIRVSRKQVQHDTMQAQNSFQIVESKQGLKERSFCSSQSTRQKCHVGTIRQILFWCSSDTYAAQFYQTKQIAIHPTNTLSGYLPLLLHKIWYNKIVYKI